MDLHIKHVGFRTDTIHWTPETRKRLAKTEKTGNSKRLRFSWVQNIWIHGKRSGLSVIGWKSTNEWNVVVLRNFWLAEIFAGSVIGWKSRANLQMEFMRNGFPQKQRILTCCTEPSHFCWCFSDISLTNAPISSILDATESSRSAPRSTYKTCRFCFEQMQLVEKS